MSYGTYNLGVKNGRDSQFYEDSQKHLNGYVLDLPEEVSEISTNPDSPTTLKAYISDDIIFIHF